MHRSRQQSFQFSLRGEIGRSSAIAKMASTGGKKTKKSKSNSGKSGKGKTLPLQNFLCDDKHVQQGYNIVTGPKMDWAEEVEKDADYRYEAITSRDKFVLPSGPKGALVDPSNIPDEPPFTAFLGNLPFDVDQEEIVDFFKPLGVVSVRLPRPGPDYGRSRGFGYAEFVDRESLITALTMNDQPFKGSRMKIDIAGQDGDGGRRRERVDRGPDRTTGDWRSARDDPLPGRDDGERGRGYSDRSYDRGNSGDRDRGFGGGGYQGDRDRDRGGNSGFPEKERDWDNVRNESLSYDQGGSRGGGRRDFGSGYRGGDRGGDRYGGDRDRYSNDRDRYAGDRDRYSNDRDRYSNDRDRYASERDRYGSERERYSDRDRYGSDRRRDDGYSQPRSNQGTERPEADNEREEDSADGPKSRQRLQLKPRTKPLEQVQPEPIANSSIFGGAKPVDTAAKEREIEARLLARERDEVVRRVPDVKEKKEESRPDVTREVVRKEVSERVRRSSASSQTSSQPRSPKTSTSGPPSARDATEGSNPALSEPEDDRVDYDKDKPLSPRREDTKAVPAPPPKENVWSKRSSTLTTSAPPDAKANRDTEKEDRHNNTIPNVTQGSDSEEGDKGRTDTRFIGKNRSDDSDGYRGGDEGAGGSRGAASVRGRGGFRGFGRGGPVSEAQVRNADDQVRGRNRNRNVQTENKDEIHTGGSKFGNAQVDDADE